MKDLEGLRPWFEGRVESAEFSGVALAWADGAPVFVYAGGWADRGHHLLNEAETRFQVASVTKMVTATTALRLVENGSLSLDKPLTGFLPPHFKPAGLDDRHTLHHLLSHTSGLANYHDDEDETWASFTSAWDRVPVYHARGPADVLPLFIDLPPAGELGEFRYSDSNYILVGVLIEWVTGRPFAEVAASEVLGPAGMDRSMFADLDLAPQDLATGYITTEDPPESWRSNIYSIPAGGMPDGGMVTTASNLASFLDALRSGRILAEDSIASMLAPHGVEEDSPEAYGYGMELVVAGDEVTIYGHSGADPGVSAMVSHYVAAGVTVVVLCNQDQGAWPTAQRIAEELGLHDPRE